MLTFFLACFAGFLLQHPSAYWPWPSGTQEQDLTRQPPALAVIPSSCCHPQPHWLGTTLRAVWAEPCEAPLASPETAQMDKVTSAIKIVWNHEKAARTKWSPCSAAAIREAPAHKQRSAWKCLLWSGNEVRSQCSRSRMQNNSGCNSEVLLLTSAGCSIPPLTVKGGNKRGHFPVLIVKVLRNQDWLLRATLLKDMVNCCTEVIILPLNPEFKCLKGLKAVRS